MRSRSTVQPKRDCSSPHFQLCSKFASGCPSSSWSQPWAPSRSPGVTATAMSDKLGLTRARKPLRQANRQRSGTVDGEVVEPDEPHHPPVEPRLEDVIAVAALPGLRTQRHAPHVVRGTAASLGIFDRPPVEQVTGLEVLGVSPRASVEVDQPGAEENNPRSAQHTAL